MLQVIHICRGEGLRSSSALDLMYLFYMFHYHQRSGKSHVCLSVCLSAAITFESLDLETLFLVRRYVFKIYSQDHRSRSSGKGQGHRNEKRVRVLFGL